MKKALATLLISCSLFSSYSTALEKDFPQVYFSHHDPLPQKLIAMIDQETSHIQIAVYLFTHRDIKNALLRALNRGVKVEILTDQNMQNKDLLQGLRKAKAEIFVFHNVNKTNKRSLMHHKFCLFHALKTVWTGSFNFTYKAGRENRENAVLLQDEGIFQSFFEEFQRIKKISQKV